MTEKQLDPTQNLDKFDLLQICRYQEFRKAWSSSADFKPVFAPEVLAIESYLHLVGLDHIVERIKQAQAQKELHGIFLLDKLVKEGYLPA